MQRLALPLILFTAMGHGRRVQNLEALKVDDEVAKLQKKMADKKFSKIQALEAEIDKDMATLVADPSLAAFNEEADRIIDEKMKELFANPEFKNIGAYSEAIDALIEELNVNVAVVNQQMESMPQQMTVEQQMKVMEEKPEFVAVQEQKKEIDDKLTAMKALPNFDKFQEHAKEVIDTEVEALKKDPKYKSAQVLAQKIDEKMDKLTSDPYFKEYQQLVIRVSELTQDEEPAAQSLAQVSESSIKVDRKSAFTVKIFPELLQLDGLTPAFDVATSHSAVVESRNTRRSSTKWKLLGN